MYTKYLKENQNSTRKTVVQLLSKDIFFFLFDQNIALVGAEVDYCISTQVSRGHSAWDCMTIFWSIKSHFYPIFRLYEHTILHAQMNRPDSLLKIGNQPLSIFPYVSDRFYFSPFPPSSIGQGRGDPKRIGQSLMIKCFQTIHFSIRLDFYRYLILL